MRKLKTYISLPIILGAIVFFLSCSRFPAMGTSDRESQASITILNTSGTGPLIVGLDNNADDDYDNGIVNDERIALPENESHTWYYDIPEGEIRTVWVKRPGYPVEEAALAPHEKKQYVADRDSSHARIELYNYRLSSSNIEISSNNPSRAGFVDKSYENFSVDPMSINVTSSGNATIYLKIKKDYSGDFQFDGTDFGNQSDNKYHSLGWGSLDKRTIAIQGGESSPTRYTFYTASSCTAKVSFAYHENTLELTSIKGTKTYPGGVSNQVYNDSFIYYSGSPKSYVITILDTETDLSYQQTLSCALGRVDTKNDFNFDARKGEFTSVD